MGGTSADPDTDWNNSVAVWLGKTSDSISRLVGSSSNKVDFDAIEWQNNSDSWHHNDNLSHVSSGVGNYDFSWVDQQSHFKIWDDRS